MKKYITVVVFETEAESAKEANQMLHRRLSKEFFESELRMIESYNKVNDSIGEAIPMPSPCGSRA